MPNPSPPFIPFAVPDLTEAEATAVADVVRDGWINTGPRAKAFEAEFAAAVGAKHGVAVNSCTAALHLAYEALGLHPGDEILVPTMTFTSTAATAWHLGAKPVLVDIRENDETIDVEKAERAVTPRTKAIAPVHYGGQACELDALLDLARRKNLRVVEDAAHAFPASYKGRPIGTFGDVTCFSFYSTKTITTAEGGMACTQDDDLAARMRIMSLHGISKDAWKRYTSEGSWYYEVLAPGFKYNLTDLAAAIGRVQLARAQEMLRKREAIAKRYLEAFDDNDALIVPTVLPDRTHAWHLFSLRLRLEALSLSRDTFLDELKARGIGTSVHYIPLHLQPCYRETFGYRPGDFPVAEDAYRRSVSLPIYSKMSDADVDRVINAILDVVHRGAAA
ncbi:MAG: DegT/DnrJ/EryC1/StrS family aminotransferase [Deltaproteobacteria bacterium]|nr:DegT/DnrJ/EryC1/StrS family aminotransferase [Deltaproteobacteria bacterium]